MISSDNPYGKPDDSIGQSAGAGAATLIVGKKDHSLSLIRVTILVRIQELDFANVARKPCGRTT